MSMEEYDVRDETRLVTDLSRRRIAELVESQAVIARACQMVIAQAAQIEGHRLPVVVEGIRAQAPMTLLETMDLLPDPTLLEGLGRMLHAALTLAWVIETQLVARRPF